jgi:hypothetical protein
MAAKEVIDISDVEKSIPNHFKCLNDIINPALIACGKIKEKVDTEFMQGLIKSVLMMQTSIQNKMKKEVCLE